MSDTPKPEFDTLPWTAGGTSYCIIDSVGAEVASFDYTKDRDYALHAVNTHPALVEALEGLLAIIDDCDPCDGGIMGYHLNGDIAHWGEFEEIETARAALLAAKGGE